MNIEELRKLANENLQLIIDVKDLHQLLDEAEGFRDWNKRTEWVQQEYSKGTMGFIEDMHRADDMKREIDSLRAQVAKLQPSVVSVEIKPGSFPVDEWLQYFARGGLIPANNMDAVNAKTTLTERQAEYFCEIMRAYVHRNPKAENWPIHACTMSVIGLILDFKESAPVDAQPWLMQFDPATGEARPYPSNAVQYRSYHGDVAWLYNPWTGDARDARDIGSDVHGLLIVHDMGAVPTAKCPAQ